MACLPFCGGAPGTIPRLCCHLGKLEGFTTEFFAARAGRSSPGLSGLPGLRETSEVALEILTAPSRSQRDISTSTRWESTLSLSTKPTCRSLVFQSLLFSLVRSGGGKKVLSLEGCELAHSPRGPGSNGCDSDRRVLGGIFYSSNFLS